MKNILRTEGHLSTAWKGPVSAKNNWGGGKKESVVMHIIRIFQETRKKRSQKFLEKKNIT